MTILFEETASEIVRQVEALPWSSGEDGEPTIKVKDVYFIVELLRVGDIDYPRA